MKSRPGKTYNSLKIVCWNARSMNNKCDSTMLFLDDNEIDVALVTETWFTEKSNVTTGTIKSSGFDIIHKFREDQRGGGAVH